MMNELKEKQNSEVLLSYGTFTSNEQQYFKTENSTKLFIDEARGGYGGIVYRILSNQEFTDAPTSTIQVNEKTFRALFVANSINFETFEKNKMFDELFEKQLFNLDTLKRMNEEYKDLVQQEDLLIKSGGRGYKGVFDNEIEELFIKIDDENVLVKNNANKALNKSFFSYDKSSIRDLSINDNGVRTVCFEQSRYPGTQYLFKFRLSDLSNWMKYREYNEIEELATSAFESLFQLAAME